MASSIPIYIRRSEINERLEKVGDLTREKSLIYSDEDHLTTLLKFSILTAASPLFAAARLVRSAVFLVGKADARRAGAEFIGGLALPLAAAYCLGGSVLSFFAYAISSGEISFYVSMRRTWAFFEAWVNRIDLMNPNLETYANRVSAPTDFYSKIWTTAPCMQPMLERGYAKHGGLQDRERMQRIFPNVMIDGVRIEHRKVVIQSRYVDHDIHYKMCGDAYEHSARERTCCCCFRVEAVYDRFCCTEVGQGRCTSMINPGNSCGIVICNTCGIGACCCYLQEDGKVKAVNAGCFGPQGPGCLI